MYTTNLRKIEDAVMLTIPSGILDAVGLSVGTKVSILVDGGRLVVEQHTIVDEVTFYKINFSRLPPGRHCLYPCMGPSLDPSTAPFQRFQFRSEAFAERLKVPWL